jgi:hypothetical protein
MSKNLASTAVGIWLSAILTTQFVAAEEAPKAQQSPEESIALDDADLRAITLQVLEKNPMLASSPGIKFASAHRGFRIRSPNGIVGTSDIADVVFYPHAESGGIKYAFHVQCQRHDPSDMWECGNANLRRYVQLDSQDFELRVVSNIGIGVVHALVEATRTTAQAGASIGSAVPQAAILVGAENGGYLVSWGNDQGHQSVMVQAHLKKGGNPAVPEDWLTEILVTED